MRVRNEMRVNIRVRNDVRVKNDMKIKIVERSNRNNEKKEIKNEKQKRSMSLHQKRDERLNNITSTNDEFDDDDLQLEMIEENHDFVDKKI